MRLKKRILTAAIIFFLLYVGSYAAFYLRGIPAGNLAYWVYLRGGNETEREEWALYYFYYPIYKIHRVFGAGRHDYDRGINYNAIYDGDEPTNKPSR
ncbi:MAG: hypothetical protein ACREE6_00060 [Limisphaerales bacterium]|jgi:hypothetical protein